MQSGEVLGRELETADLCARAVNTRSRLTTLIGPGGVGKTALAVHVADATRAAFEHGTSMVELASVTAPELVLPAVCQAFGVLDAGGRPLLETLLESCTTGTSCS